MKTELLLIIIYIIVLTGCCNNNSKESLRIYPDRVEWTSSVSQSLFLYFTTTKQMKKVTPLTETTVGLINSRPDPNSIASVGGAVGEALNKMVK
jgi:hypothetical protein